MRESYLPANKLKDTPSASHYEGKASNPLTKFTFLRTSHFIMDATHRSSRPRQG